MARFSFGNVECLQTSTPLKGVVSKIPYTVTSIQGEEEKSKTSIKTPGFQPGVFMIKPYSVSSRRVVAESQVINSQVYIEPGTGTRIETRYSGRLNGRSYCLNMLEWVPVEQTQLRKLCVHRALGKVNEAVWDSLVDLGEIGSTARLLMDPAKELAASLVRAAKNAEAGLRKGLPAAADIAAAIAGGGYTRSAAAKAVRKKYFGKKNSYGHGGGDAAEMQKLLKRQAKDAEKAIEAVGHAWLAGRYGWTPAYLSLQDALEALKASLLKADKKILTARSRMTTNKSGTKQGNWYSTYTRVDWTNSYRIEGIAYYRRTADQRLIDVIGLKPENLPATAWELSKLSFVWDWFFHVSDWLAALKPEYGVEILGTSDSQKTLITNRWTTQYQMGSSPIWTTTQPDTATQESFDRKINTAVGLPAFTGVETYNLIKQVDTAALAFKPLLDVVKGLRRN